MSISTECEVDNVKEAIRFAYHTLEPREALERIAKIWEELDGAVDLAQARSRLLLNQVRAPEVVEGAGLAP